MPNEPLTAGQALVIIVIMFALAFMIETIVEALVGKPIDEFPKLKPYKKYILTYIAVIAGVAGAWVYHFDLIFLLVSYLQETVSQKIPIGITPFGITATGFAVGMGSTYLHQFIGKFFLKPSSPIPPITTTTTVTNNQPVMTTTTSLSNQEVK